MKKIYLVIIFFIIPTITYSQKPCHGITTVKYAGKTYNTIKIGDQCWLQENLDVGTMINGSQDQENNGVIEKYCYYNNTTKCTKYGGLYQWDEAMQYNTSDTRIQGICPKGWHIPDETEFSTLKDAVNNDGDALKAFGEGTGTNKSGFLAMLGGFRFNGGYFDELGVYSIFWSSTESNEDKAYYMNLSYNFYSININDVMGNKIFAFSVRCIKDN